MRQMKAGKWHSDPERDILSPLKQEAAKKQDAEDDQNRDDDKFYQRHGAPQKLA